MGCSALNSDLEKYARYSKNSFRFAASTLWNSLPDHFSNSQFTNPFHFPAQFTNPSHCTFIPYGVNTKFSFSLRLLKVDLIQESFAVLLNGFPNVAVLHVDDYLVPGRHKFYSKNSFRFGIYIVDHFIFFQEFLQLEWVAVLHVDDYNFASGLLIFF